MSFKIDGTCSLAGSFQPRNCKGITFIGPDLFAEDDEGKLLSPIGSIFPYYRTIVTVRGIHALHASIMLDYIGEMRRKAGVKLDLEEENRIFEDSVALVIRNEYLLIRSDPDRMDHMFAADEILQAFLPKDRIQFTGLHLPEVRARLRQRGESWRMSPPPRSVSEIAHYVHSSRVQVGTGLTVYYNAPTGGRFLTCEEFMRIGPLLRQDSAEALARMREIVHLFERTNSWGNRELSFFLPADKRLDYDGIIRTISLLEDPSASDRMDEIESAFDRFASLFAETAGAELTVDDEENAVWRTTMFCRLSNLDEHEMEEWTLGLSPEFLLNVKWLPGATVVEDRLRIDPCAAQRVRGLLKHFWEQSGGFVSINLGRVRVSQSGRDITGEERDVYLVVMAAKGGQESIRLVRLMKWDVVHRIKTGVPINQAVAETLHYRDYIFDRLMAAARLGFPTLSYSQIRLEEDIPGLGKVPSFFFERQYIPGTVTDKISLSCYKRKEFIIKLAAILGSAAAFTLVLGRASPRTGQIFYDDGDELVQFDSSCMPKRLVIIETTGSFTDWTTPMIYLLPQCLERFRVHLQKAQACEVPRALLVDAVAAFADSLTDKIHRVQVIASSGSVKDLFKDRVRESGGVRDRWEGILARLKKTDPVELKSFILDYPDLDPRSLRTRSTVRSVYSNT